MIYLFHGGGLVGMSKKISDIKKNFDPEFITEVSSKTSNLGQALTAAQSVSLFGEKRLLILEDFQNIVIDKLPLDPSLDIIVKFTRSLISTSVLIKAASRVGAQILTFPEEKETSMFPFLDALSEKNPKALTELGNHLDEWGSQYVLTMIFYNLRKMVLPPGKNLPPFVLQKMEKQKKNFSLSKIKSFYKKTIETDFKIKSGLLDEKMGMFLLTEEFLR